MGSTLVSCVRYGFASGEVNGTVTQSQCCETCTTESADNCSAPLLGGGARPYPAPQYDCNESLVLWRQGIYAAPVRASSTVGTASAVLWSVALASSTVVAWL